MDNFYVHIVSEGESNFKAAMRIIFQSQTAKYYGVNAENSRMILYWVDPKDCGKEKYNILPLAYEMNADEAIPFVWGWLQHATYSRQPDHDGDNGKGFVVKNESWGHAGGIWQGFAEIHTGWAMYGK